MKTIAITIAALLAASLASSPSTAQPAPRPIAVAYADLDLSTAQGRAALDLRLLHAARTACGTPSPADPRGQASLAECVAQARLAAIVQRDAALAQARLQSQPVLASTR